MTIDHAAPLSALLAALFLSFSPGCADSVTENQDPLRLSVVFNNEPLKKGLTTVWGFSCFIEGLEQTILFDTGGEGGVLLSNMQAMEIAPEKVDLVVLSHYHGDHTEGLEKIQAANPRMTVYMPRSFPEAFRERIESSGTEVIPVAGSVRLLDRAWSTGEMGKAIIEQAVMLDTPKGVVVVTGCAHPGIVEIVEKAKEITAGEIYMVLGGFHLGRHADSQVREIIGRFRELGVRKVGPTHCTGERAVQLFKESYGEDFVAAGCGAVIEI